MKTYKSQMNIAMFLLLEHTQYIINYKLRN